MKQFLMAASLIVATSLTATCLYFNHTWQTITHAWLEGWARHML
jgi:hypothetical protein